MMPAASLLPRTPAPTAGFGTWAMALCAALLTVALLPSGARAQEAVTPFALNESQRRQIQTDQVLVQVTAGRINRGEAVGVVRAPIEEVWPIVEDCGKYDDWRDVIKDTAVLRRESASTVICKGTTILPFPAQNRHGHFRVKNVRTKIGGADAYLSTFHYLKGSGNVEEMYGYWLLQSWGAAGEHTIVKHVMNVDMGGFVPDFLVRWASNSIMPSMITGIRDRHKVLAKRKRARPTASSPTSTSLPPVPVAAPAPAALSPAPEAAP